MSSCRTNCWANCCSLFLISVIIGIGVGALFLLGLLPTIATVLPFIIGFAIFVLLALTLLLIFKSSVLKEGGAAYCESLKSLSNCICNYALCLLIAALLTLLFAIILFVIFTVVALVVATQVFVFLTAIAFFWMLLTLFALLACIISALCRYC